MALMVAAGGIAAINSLGNLAGFSGPYAMGWIKDSTGGFGAGLLCLRGRGDGGRRGRAATASRFGAGDDLAALYGGMRSRKWRGDFGLVVVLVYCMQNAAFE